MRTPSLIIVLVLLISFMTNCSSGRKVEYEIYEDKRNDVNFDVDYNFFSPRFGANYNLNEKMNVFGNFSVAQRRWRVSKLKCVLTCHGATELTLTVGTRDLLISMFLGAVQFGLGFCLITLATRHIDGDLIALLTLSEVVLAPLWVWIGVNEVPAPIALAGGLIVLTAVAGQIVWKLKRGGHT